MKIKDIEELAYKHCGYDTDSVDGTLRSSMRMECFIAGAKALLPEIYELVSALKTADFYANYGLSEDGRRIKDIIKKHSL